MASASDNFNRADGALGANWSPLANASTNPALVIFSNAVRDPSFVDAVLAVSIYTGIAFAPDQYSQATAVTAANTGSSVGVNVRGLLTTAVGVGGYIYRFAVNGPLGGTVDIAIRKIVNDVESGIATGTATVNSNDVLGLQVIGTVLKAFINGVQVLTASDADLAFGYPGLEAFAGSALTDTSLDNWSGNDILVSSFKDFPKPKIRDAVRAGWIA